MLDNFLNSCVLALIVAIAGALASVSFQDSTPHASGTDTKRVSASTTVAADTDKPRVVEADAAVSVPVLQLPTVVVVGHRERAVEPTSIAAAD